MLHKSISLVVLVAFLCLTACSSETSSNIEKDPGSTSADFELLDQNSVNLLADRRLQLINYWASWCLPCIEEMPELADFRNRYQRRVEVYAVNYDGLTVDQLRQAVQALGIEIPALFQDPNERLGYQKPTVLPTTIILVEGQVKEVLVGPQTRETLEVVLQKWGT